MHGLTKLTRIAALRNTFAGENHCGMQPLTLHTFFSSYQDEVGCAVPTYVE